MRRSRQILTQALRGFRGDEGFHLAANLAFFAILSLIPLGLIVISVLGHILGQSELLLGQVVIWMRNTIPGVESEFIALLRDLVARKVQSGWLGIVLMFLVASLLFTSMERAFDKVLRSSRRRNFWHSRALAVGLIFVTALLFFLPAFGNFLGELMAPWGVHLEIGRMLRHTPFFVLSHGIVFLFVLRVVPNQSIRWRYLGCGALLFAISALAMRWLFRTYMALALERYHLLYGSFTVIVLLILWLYYLSILSIFCAEVVGVLNRPDRGE